MGKSILSLHCVTQRCFRKEMRESNSPMVLWDYCIERRVLTHKAVLRTLFQAQVKTPHECTFGNQSDISNHFLILDGGNGCIIVILVPFF